MANTLQKCAEILVEHGYGYCIPTTFNFIPHEGAVYLQMVKQPDPFQANQYVEVNPFADNIEGIHQLHAIENWLHRNHQGLLIMCKDAVQSAPLSKYDGYKKRKDRIEWCVEELMK